MGRSVLTWLLLLISLFSVHAGTSNTARQQEAEALIEKQFVRNKALRKWKAAKSTRNYIRYECEQQFCNPKSSACWKVSLHVHSQRQRHLDRMYIFSLKKGRKAFLGAIRKIGLWKRRALVKAQKLRRPPCRRFCSGYDFRRPSTVILQNAANKYSLRVNPRSKGQLDSGGLLGRWSQWTVELEDKGAVLKLKSGKTGRFLGMKSASSIGVLGDGRSDADRWRVRKQGGGYTRLENKKYPGACGCVCVCVWLCSVSRV